MSATKTSTADHRVSASISTNNAPATQTLAARLAQQCHATDCILLRGELGTGKTTFARGFIQALTHMPEEVVSPTFTLVQTYPMAKGGLLWHFDLYRLRAPEELQEIGLEEALFDGLTLIEWPELAQSALPVGALEVTITLGNQPEQRMLTFSGLASVWAARLTALKEHA